MKRPERVRLSRFALLVVVACVAVLSSVAASAFAMTSTGGLRSPDARSASCRTGFKPAIIGGSFKCLKAGRSCTARYQKAYRKYGFHCLNGRLRKGSGVSAPALAPPPPAPPPPAPTPPPATPGHYKGLTSQMTTFEFDVTLNGRGVANLVTGQVNQGCTPAFHLWGGQINLGSYVIPIANDGSFAVSWSGSGTVGSAPATGRTSITGHLSGATAVGNLEETTNFTWTGGVAYACGSGLQNWTVTRTS
jgi:hypothetical protein